MKVLKFGGSSISNAENIENVLKSDLYKFMVSKNYTLANWLHSDLVFVNNNFSD